MAFLHQFQPDMRPILPEICCKEVEDWEIEWEEFKARLNLSHQQQQPQSQIKKICKSESSTKQEFASPSPEIQERKEEEAGLDADQNSTKKSTTNSTEPTTTNSDSNQEGEEMEITTTATKPVEAVVMPCSAVMKKVLNSIASSEEEPPPFLDSSGGGLSVEVGGTEDGAFTVGEGESDGSGGSPLGREKQIAQGRRLRFGERNDGGGGSNHHRRVLSIVARPPNLLAVAFPWNRDIEMVVRSVFLAREMMPRAPTTLFTEGPLVAVAADAIMLLSMAHGCCSTWRKMEDAV